jgi:imidazolonepropionase
MTRGQTTDLTIRHAAELLVCPAEGKGLGIIEDGALLARDGRIVWVGRTADLAVESSGPLDDASGRRIIDASGRVVMPGLVECHTHLVFGGSREHEFQMRAAGASYAEIAAAGGGIMSTVRATRAASTEELLERGRANLRAMLRLGLTTVEAKSGYGLSTEHELRLLEVYRDLDAEQPVDVVPTFLGAHVVGPEYRDRPEAYVDLVVEEMIPEVAERGLARFCDVFCEQGAFTLQQSRRVLTAGLEHGLRPKLHADQFADGGGGELAAELGAVSADHLDHIGDTGVAAMAAAGVTAVLLPGAVAFLGLHHFAPARRLLADGVRVALSTDFNPGSCHCMSPFIVATLASSYLKMSLAEVLRGWTCEPAAALGLAGEVGSLEEGRRADIVVLDTCSAERIPYDFGVDHVHTVVKDGLVVHEAPRASTPARRALVEGVKA